MASIDIRSLNLSLKTTKMLETVIRIAWQNKWCIGIPSSPRRRHPLGPQSNSVLSAFSWWSPVSWSSEPALMIRTFLGWVDCKADVIVTALQPSGRRLFVAENSSPSATVGTICDFCSSVEDRSRMLGVECKSIRFVRLIGVPSTVIKSAERFRDRKSVV